jgi:hypothetical protein
LKEGIHLFLVFSLVLASLGCVNSLRDYKAKSVDEELIKGVLVQWENSGNSGDVVGVLNVFRDDAEIVFENSGGQRTIESKKKYGEMLPGRMKANPKVSVGLPKITVCGERAVVDVLLTTQRGIVQTKFYLLREKGKWLITRLECMI